MATRNFVPRADGEGKLGTPSKKWGDVYATTIHGSLDGNASSATIATDATNDADGNPISSTYVKKDSDYLGYRQPSTAYTTGAMAYHATLPAGWYLECTTAGTTGSGTLTITTPTVGGTVSDGTVTWTIRKNASTQDLTGYLPLSGGAMTGTTINRAVSNSSLVLKGGYTTNEAYLELCGKDSNYTGDFFLVARSASNNEKNLRGRTDGTLTWGGNSLDKSAVVAESLRANGYRKTADGVIEQWGSFRNVSEGYMPAGSYTIYFPISFPTVSRVITSSTDKYNVAVTSYSNDKINITVTGPVYEIFWRAIGY